MNRVNSFGVDIIYRLDKKDKTQVHLYARITVNGKPAEISLNKKFFSVCGIQVKNVSLVKDTRSRRLLTILMM